MNRCLFELILAIKRRCQSNEERIQQELGLSQAEFNGLIVLDSGREMTGSDFAKRMALSPSRGSRVLNRLVLHGYVKTRLSPDDRRAVLIGLTPKGKAFKRRIVEGMRVCEQRVCAGLNRRDLRQVTSALELLESVL